MRQVYGLLRRTVGRHPDRAMAAIVLLLVAGLAWPWLSPVPVRAADSAVDDLKAVALSDVGLSQRLLALVGCNETLAALGVT